MSGWRRVNLIGIIGINDNNTSNNQKPSNVDLTSQDVDFKVQVQMYLKSDVVVFRRHYDVGSTSGANKYKVDETLILLLIF